MSTLPTPTRTVKAFETEHCSVDLLGRLGFRLPEPIDDDATALRTWPTLQACRATSPGDALQEAVACAEQALRAYPPGEAPAALEQRLEILLSRAFRERHVTKRGKLGADRPALPDMRRGHMKSLSIHRVAEYRIVKVLTYVRHTPVELAFLNDMRTLLEFFDHYGKRNRNRED